MAFKILRNDITKVRAEAIVNTANPRPIVGSGTDSTVYKAAGWEELLEERRKIGGIARGQSACTPAFRLEANGVKYIIHTIGTHYRDGKSGEVDIVRSCYRTSLQIAAEKKCKSVALPLLASGNYRFPKEIALQIAVEEISRFLLEHDIDVFLVVYDDESYKISEKFFDDVEDFLSDNLEGHKGCEETEASRANQVEATGDAEQAAQEEKQKPPANVDDFIKNAIDKLSFQKTLAGLIEARGVENSYIYKRACIDRKFFSKILTKKDYVPKKHIVMALGLALELPLKEYEEFLATAGYAFMPSSKFDWIVKYCVIKHIYNLINVDVILNDHGEECFAPE